MKTTAPFGSWESPVTVEFVSGKDRGLGHDLVADGNDLYFLESRPDEGGRVVLMRRDSAGQVAEALPSDCNLRTRYLEYGAKCFGVWQGRIFFVQWKDQQIYSCRVGESPVRITNDTSSRFADLVLDAKRERLIALRELTGTGHESKNSVCAIDLRTGAIEDLVTGHDFFNSARLNEAGDRLLWISWDHPNMAWNGTELWESELDSRGAVKNARRIAGDSTHGVCQARWGRGNEITFVAELEEWFNLYRFRDGKVEALHRLEAEFAHPDWTPGQQQSARSGETICASFLQNGLGRFLLLREGKVRVLPETFAGLSSVEAGPRGFFALVISADRPARIVEISHEGKVKDVYSSYRLALATEEIAAAEPTEFPTLEGGVGHAWFYAPKNSRFTGPAGEKPPLMVMCHGGPTAFSSGDFKKGVQFWTNRGYAVVDVNYGGSTGYGRKYRERLRGQWGVVDVNDCVAVVQHLARAGRIDPRRVAIRGGSAGGYTTLAALTFTEGVIAVGASYYGVSELELLAKETHKLEARYLDQLVGPYPEALAKYRERSPLAQVDRLRCPIIFFQGEEDKVVLPNQSQLMYESLVKKGVASEYHLYPGEGHGFRQSATVQHSLKAEHAFYARTFGFSVAAQDRL